MKSEVLTVGDVCESVSQTYRGIDEYVVTVNTSDVLDGVLLNHEKVKNSNLKGQFKKSFQKDDILYSEIRPANKRCALIKFEDTACYVASTKLMVLRAKQDVVLPEYLYAFLTSQPVLAELQHLAETRSGTFPQITFSSELAPLSILCPPLATQRKIAAVLSFLDDKIETNNAICRNLEELAEALYKRLIETKGNESDIYAIANIVYGAPFASRQFNTEGKGMPLIRIRDLKRQYSDTYTEERHPKAYLIQPGDIVVGMDGEFQPYIWGGEEALLNQRVCVFQNKRAKGSFFLYFVLKPLLYRIEQTEMATTVIHIGKQDFDAFRFSMPPEAALREYEECTHPLYNQIVSLNQENRRLASLRDTLLPRLMSGELDVSAVKL